MARLLRMPDVASDDDEGVLSSWLLGERDVFDAAQTIAYVETNTLLLSVEAGRPGVLLRTLVGPGTQVDAGTPIGVIGDLDERNLDLETLLAELGVDAADEAEPEAEPATAPEPATEPEPEPEAVHEPEPEQPRHASDARPSFFTPELAIPVFEAGPALRALTEPEPEEEPGPAAEPVAAPVADPSLHPSYDGRG